MFDNELKFSYFMKALQNFIHMIRKLKAIKCKQEVLPVKLHNHGTKVCVDVSFLKKQGKANFAI
jgi:hypothetical protein